MDEVSAAADRAAEALAAERFQEASDLYDQVIAGIGDSYRHEGTLDDTPTKLAMARAQAAKGEWRSAANLKKSVAESRLALAHGR